jgi:septal ring factor EnvC (AmiA/AmiB activator)
VRPFILAAVVLPLAAHAQDIRGLEVCTAEKDMTRRTSCLQANVQFLQGALDKVSREATDRLAAANREIAAQKADIAALKEALAKMQADLSQLKKKDAPAK